MNIKYIRIGNLRLPIKCLHAKFINGFYVPCGKCEFCQSNLAKEWAFRCRSEAEHKFVYNVLLTYDDEFLPFHHGTPSLNRVHVQLFMKRFRYYLNEIFGGKVRFFGVGEYGGKRGRPHYHILLFTDVQYDIDIVNEIIDESWTYGMADCEPINGKYGPGPLVYYFTAYLLTQLSDVEYDKYNKPFRMMSRDGGIGLNWISEHPKTVKKCVEQMNYYVKDRNSDYGQMLPRYLKRKIMPEEQQIAFADEFYYLCSDYNNYQKSLKLKENEKERKQFLEELKKQRVRQNEREKSKYRKVKIHRNNRLASKVSARTSK